MKEDFLNQNYKDKDTDGAFKRVFDLSPDAMLKIRTADFRLIAANQHTAIYMAILIASLVPQRLMTWD